MDRTNKKIKQIAAMLLTLFLLTSGIIFAPITVPETTVVYQKLILVTIIGTYIGFLCPEPDF